MLMNHQQEVIKILSCAPDSFYRFVDGKPVPLRKGCKHKLETVGTTSYPDTPPQGKGPSEYKFVVTISQCNACRGHHFSDAKRVKK